MEKASADGKAASEEGQLLETGSYVEGVMNGDHAAENSAEIIEVQEGMVSRSLNFFPYNSPKWIDFRDAVDEYAKSCWTPSAPPDSP